MTAPRTCARCGTESADTVGVVVSHGRAPQDGVDLCRACDAERCELAAERAA